MKKLFFAFALLISTTLISNAQDYSTGVGFRGGFYNGITVKHFMTSENALEGILSTRWSGFNVTGLYEIHNSAFDTPGLKWYYGAGGHLGTYDGDNKRYDDGDNHLVIGIDGILGIEYSFAEAPINLGLDWKPTFDLIGGPDFWGDEIALSIRFIF